MESPPSSSINLAVSVTALAMLVPCDLNNGEVPNPAHIQTDCSTNLNRLIIGRIIFVFLGCIGYDSVKRSLEQANYDTIFNNEYMIHPNTSGQCCCEQGSKCDVKRIDVKFLHLNSSGVITKSVDMCMCDQREESIRGLLKNPKVRDAFQLDLTKDLDKFKDALGLDVQLSAKASQPENFLKVLLAFQREYPGCCISPTRGSLLAYASLYIMLNASTDPNSGGIRVNTLSSSDITCMESEFTDNIALDNVEIQRLRGEMISGSDTDRSGLSIRSVVDVTFHLLIGPDPGRIVHQYKMLSRPNELLVPSVIEEVGEIFSRLGKDLNNQSIQSSSNELLMGTAWMPRGKLMKFGKPPFDRNWELFTTRLPNLGVLDKYLSDIWEKYHVFLPVRITPDNLFHDENTVRLNSADFRELSLMAYGTIIAGIALRAAYENERWEDLLERIKFLIRFQVPTSVQLPLSASKKRMDELSRLNEDEEGVRLYDLTKSENNGMAATLALFKIMEVALSCEENDGMSSKVERFFAMANCSTEKTTKQYISVLGE